VRVEIGLLRGFSVSVDGSAVPADSWRRRQAAALVKVLALAPGARLHRDRVVDALWPELDIDTALPRLHKAAHFARQAMRSRDAVVLKDELVALFPSDTVDVDVAAFEAAADAALKAAPASSDECAAAASLYRGDLLPDDLNEQWSEEPRRRLRARWEQLLRGAGRWRDLLEVDPTDEQAHVELLREAVLAGDRAGALRRYDEMTHVLATELGVAPSPEATALRERIVSPQPSSAHPQASDAAWARTRSMPEETLVERDDELAALVRTARSVVRTGRGSVVVISGEAGSGKSSLVRAFVGQLDDSVAVAVGGCDDLLAPRSLGPFRDLADSIPEVASALASGSQPEDILPALFRLLAARPTVLVLEDVHWADDATLDAIRYLSRRIAGVAAILLLTLRDEEADATHPVRRILGGLGSSSTRRIELGPLSVEAVRRLSGVDDAEALEIHRVTRGNPFFVTEVLAAGGDDVPATVRDAVLARVGRLQPKARRLAERLAVIPSRAERWLAEALADDEPGTVAQAERSGVIGGGAEYVGFRHELARRVVENSLTVGELVLANREVLEVLLKQRRIEPSRIVHHAVRAARVDLLIQYGQVAAADAERTGAHRQAAETLRLVLAHADALDSETQARLLTRRAYSLYVVNEYEAALADIESAVSMAEACGDAVVLAEALIVRSRIAFFAQGPTTARHAARRAVELLEAQGDARANDTEDVEPADTARLATALIELARTYSNLATVGIVSQPSADTLHYAQRAVELCEGLGRDDLRAQALWYLGSGQLAAGDPRGWEAIDRSIAIGSAETRLETRVRSYVNAAGSAYRCGRFGDARRYVATGLRLAADGEFAAGEYRLRLTSAAMSASAGAWDDAITELRGLVSGPGRGGVMALLVRSLLARLLARRGDPDGAVILAEALADPIGTHDSYVAGPLAAAQIELGWLSGTADEIPPRVWQAMDLAAESGHSAMQGELAVYLRRSGHVVDVPTAVPDPWAAALAGNWRESAQSWNRLGERYEEAVEIALAADEQASMVALDTLRELGATATVARVMTQRG
jgi:DNA-binding SARP family transcriptional activator/tetratricopeptide (TPR) repeat protein